MRWVATILLLICPALGWAATTNYALAPSPETPSEFTMKTWRMSDGLPSERVRALIQTRDGYIWVGTFNGLARFDGVRFQSFRDADIPELHNSLVNELFEDSQDRLWIGHDTGEITYRDATGFHLVSTFTNWPTGPVDNFVEAPRGTVLALNREGVIGVFRDGVSIGQIGSLDDTRYSELAVDRDGQIWAVRRGGSVVGLRDGKEVRGLEIPAPPTGFRNIYNARRGGIWVRTGNQISRWDKGIEVENRGIQPWKTTLGVVMHETVNGDLLVGTLYEGFFAIPEHGETVQVNRDSGLPNNWVSCLLEDREHNLWAGNGSGLTQLRPAVLTMLNPKDHWEHRAVESIWAGPNGRLWVSTEGSGLYYYQSNSFRRFFDMAGTGNRIRSVLEDSQGRVWIGSQAGLRTLDGSEIVPANAGVELPSLIYALHEARDGTLWVGTQNGLASLHDGKWSRLGKDLYRADVRCIVEATNGSIWVGMRGGGVARYQNGAFTQFLRPQGLPYEYIWSMFADADGSLWIGTSGGGLAHWRDGKFFSLTTKQGLPNDFICGIQDDDEGNLWIASYGGIFRVAKSNLERCERGQLSAITPLVLGSSAGLTSLEMSGGNHPSACRLPDGRILFPTSEGLAVVDPKKIQLNPLPPMVRIEETLIDREFVKFDEVQKAASLLSAPRTRLEVPPGKVQLEFRYTALSFASPERVRFRIRLKGIDRDWVEVGERRTAYYTHVTPGDYEFQVIACNHQGVWNEDGAVMEVKVRPFFWQTWWFAPLCWCGGAALVSGVVALNLRRRHRRKIESLEQARMVERERRRIAQDLHDELGAGLTEIGSTSTLAHETANDPAEAREYFQEISNRSRELVTSMDEIVWAVNPTNDTLASVTSYFCHYAEHFLRTTPLRCRFEVPDVVPPLPLNAEQRHSLFLAFKEALNNAVRHSGGSEVKTAFAISAHELRITVSDNGRGLNGVDTPGADGLTNMRNRLQQLGGRCEFKPAPDGGTQVTFVLPLGRDGKP